jgi:fatty-acyl-CoA synthase
MALIKMQQAAQTPRKDTVLSDWVRALEATAPIAKNPRRILPHVIADLAQTQGDALALISLDESLTYRALAERANRYARWALDQHLAKGDTVCLLMPNRPDYMAMWLGVTSVGGGVALLNTNLRGGALAHCIDIVAPKHVVVAAEFVEHYRAAMAQLKSAPAVWTHGASEFARIDQALGRYSGAPLNAAEARDVTIADRALNIYTSGTTGLPKAANVSHQRLMQWSFWFAGLMDTSAADRMYDCLPMYHSVGGVVATGCVLVRGGSVVLRDKFSAQRFWDDVCEHDCTLFQYIGELCRYLVNAPEHPRERAHRLRLCCGNGLRGDVWGKFQARFAIPRILEFYAATEANVSLYNVEGKAGAIGRVPSFLTHRFPLALVTFDEESGEPARGPDGLCVRCAVNESGEALGRIHDGSAQHGEAFEGYTSAEDSERKIVRDVAERGDAWFRTGDLMRRDAAGFYYFVDRIGDSFRWKGENVATTEVTEAIAAFPGISEAVVYGVAVPGTEGAAGMATIVADAALDLAALRAHLAQRVPSYARPLFLRIMERIEVTPTFKHRKSNLVRDGFDPAATADAIYVDDPARQTYVRLDGELYRRIQDGEVRL